MKRCAKNGAGGAAFETSAKNLTGVFKHPSPAVAARVKKQLQTQLLDHNPVPICPTQPRLTQTTPSDSVTNLKQSNFRYIYPVVVSAWSFLNCFIGNVEKYIFSIQRQEN